jgi:alpha-beta hydrolase superfamily lysophospholipase
MLVFAVVYIALSIALARRFALADHVDRSAIKIELPTLGHHIALYHHAPESQRFAEPVIVCHGLGANRFNMDFSGDGTGSDRISIARALARAGFDTWVLELRGRGQALVPRGADWCVDDEVREDVPTAIETVLGLTGAQHVLWVGHSKGSLLQYLLQAEGLPAASKVKAVVAIGSPGNFRMPKPTVALLVMLGALFVKLKRPIPLSWIAKLGIPISTLIHYGACIAIPTVKSIHPNVLRRVMASLATDISPGVMRQFSTWFRSGGTLTRKDGTSYDEHFSNIKVPMLFIAGGKDLLAPVASLQHVYDRITSEDKTIEVVDDYGHGDLVIGARAPDEVFPRVITWLEKHASEAS